MGLKFSLNDIRGLITALMCVSRSLLTVTVLAMAVAVLSLRRWRAVPEEAATGDADADSRRFDIAFWLLPVHLFRPASIGFEALGFWL